MSSQPGKSIILDKVHLKGFKSIEDLSVELTRGLNILIGKNGSGKSNFLEFLNDAISVKYGNRSFSFSKFEFSGEDESFMLLVEKESRHEKLKSKFKAEDDFIVKVIQGDVVLYDSSYDSIDKETDQLFKDFVQRILGRRAGPRPGDSFRNLSYRLRTLLVGFNIPDHINFISVPGQIKITEDFEWEWGSTLDFIEDLLIDVEFNNEPGDFVVDKVRDVITKDFKISEVIVENLSMFSPIKNIRLSESFGVYTADNGLIIDNIRFDFYINDSWVPWTYLSDGTKRLFYIIVEVTQKYDGLVLIEEPELGIHPHQFQLLMTFLKEQAENKQIIISTHSPKALDILNPDELDHIMIAGYEKMQGTQIRKLTTDQKEKAKGYMQDVGFLSDYWLMSDLE